MTNTVYYDKYPSTIWRAFILLIYVTFIKSIIEITVGIASGAYLGLYAALMNLDFDILFVEVTNTVNLLSVAISDLLLISILLYSMKKRRIVPINFKEALSKKPSIKFSVLAILGVFAVSLIGGLVTQGLISIFNAELPETIQSMMEVESVFTFETLVTFITVVIAAPLFEEFLLRKIMMDGLLKNYKPLTVIVITAVFFAAFHMNLVQGAYTFFLGLYLAYIYYLTGSFWLVTVIHSVNNLYAVLARLVPETVINPIAYSLMFAGFISLIILLKSKSEKVQWTPLPEEKSIEDAAIDHETSKEQSSDDDSKEAFESGNA